MIFSYSIDERKEIARVIIPEETNLAENLEVVRQHAVDERLGENFGVLVDVRALSSLPTAEEARMFALEIAKADQLLHHRIAAVASRPVQYGMGNMISIIASLKGVAIRMFYDMEEAEAWLQMGHNGPEQPTQRS